VEVCYRYLSLNIIGHVDKSEAAGMACVAIVRHMSPLNLAVLSEAFHQVRIVD
jgi:hypothetical protein